MLIVTIRTDSPDAEIGLFEDQKKLGYEVWHADRQLSITIHSKIDEILRASDKQLNDVKGLVCFAGPGSFTGLRIGLTVGNAMAYGLDIPIVAELGDKWVDDGIKRLKNGQSDEIAMPEYGADPHITKQKK